MPNVLTGTPLGAGSALSATAEVMLAGTYPGATTYPGADVYPGRGNDLVAVSDAPQVLTATPA